ncbi:MAG TPA: hypothetical protein VLJ76_09945 [Gaiellaceae bacterium]|nr:hypothetical protein [Gaiellaceae bacterium]
MDGVDLAVAIVAAMFFLAVIFAIGRLIWRLRTGDIESVGSDGRIWRGPYRKRRPR